MLLVATYYARLFMLEKKILIFIFSLNQKHQKNINNFKLYAVVSKYMFLLQVISCFRT